MTIKPGSMVRIKGCRKVWKVSRLVSGSHDAILYRRERAMMPTLDYIAVHQVWPVSMLQLVAAA